MPEVAKVVFDVDGEPVRPALSKPALKLGRPEASRMMRRKRADFHQGQQRGIDAPIQGRIYDCNRILPFIGLQPCARAGSI